MFKQLDLKVIGGIIIIAVLLVAGIYSYSKWSYNRFATEIGAAPQSTTPSEPVSEPDKITSSEQSKETQSVNENVKVKPKSIVKSEVVDTAKEGAADEFDAASILSDFGMPEEVASLLDEDAEEKDFEKAEEHLAEKYGQSPEVEALIDKLKQLSTSTVQFGDLLSLLETWIDALPAEEHEIRQRLTNSLFQLQNIKGLGGDTQVRFIPPPVLNPTQSGGSDSVTISGGNARIIQEGESRVVNRGQ